MFAKCSDLANLSKLVAWGGSGGRLIGVLIILGGIVLVVVGVESGILVLDVSLLIF